MIIANSAIYNYQTMLVLICVSTSTYFLLVSDADGDIIRCRWAQGSECAGVCRTFPGAILDEVLRS